MRSLFKGMWEAVSGSPPCSATHLTEEEARRLRAQVERDLKRDIEELLDKVEPTAETWNRRY